MQQDQDPKQPTDERRRFFRIDDSVHLGLKAVPQAELDQRIQDLEHRVGDSFTLVNSLNAITQQQSPHLRRIEQDYPDIAAYLRSLDKKLELLSQALLVEEVEMMDKPAIPVNLSAGGMAVHSRDPIPEGTLVEIKLLLVPSYTGILTYGRVVNCGNASPAERDPDYPYVLRIDFSFIRDADQDALIRHVLLKQAEWLRRRRERREC